MHLCEWKAFVLLPRGKSLSNRSSPKACSLPVAPEFCYTVFLSPCAGGRVPASFPGPLLGAVAFISEQWCGARWLYHNLAVCPLRGLCTSVFTSETCPFLTALKRDGMRWFLWSYSCSHVSWREGGWFPWELLRRGRHISSNSGWELPSAPDTMLQTLEEYPGPRPLLFL